MSDEELIRGYYNETLNPTERTEFEERLESDNEFKEQAQSMELELLAFRNLERESIKSKFNDWEAEVEESGNSPLNIKSWKVWSTAAAIILIGTLTFRLINTEDADLYSSYYSYYDNYEVTTLRNQPDELTNREKAYQHYDLKDFKSAVVTFEQLDTLQKADQFFLSLSYMGADEWNKAEAALTEIQKSDFAYQSASKWYLALVYIKLEKHQKSLPILESIQSDSEFGEKAKELLHKLKN
ncbi:MAG: hypothetical protein NXI20_04630 [bacterium]|nr:hypothetical protein [bacterium]